MLKRILLEHDWIITVCTALLSIIGITTLYSMSVGSVDPTVKGEYAKQIIFAIIGFIIYFLISKFDYSLLKFKEVLISLYIVVTALLLILKALNTSVRSTQRWIQFIGGLSIQPSEFAKLFVIILVASVLTIASISIYKKIALSLVLIAPLLFMVYKQPSLGVTLIMLGIWLSAVYFIIPFKLKLAFLSFLIILCIFLGLQITTINKLYLLSIPLFSLILYFLVKLPLKTLIISVFVGLLVGIGGEHFIWNHLQSYQKCRIESFFNSAQCSGGNFQVNQSKIAFGSGELLGKGFAQGTQSRLNFLPEHTTDFIFAAFGEEFGFVGALLVYLLYIVLLFKLVLVLDNCPDTFGVLIITGVTTMIILQILINMGMNLGLMPVTGIPLPLMSYGGSSMITTFIALGLTQSIERLSKKGIEYGMNLD